MAEVVEDSGLAPVPEETERYLLIEAVRRNSLSFLVEQGIQANYFRTYEKAAKVLFDYFNKYQCLPSQKRLARDMDIFDWNDFPEERDVPDLMEELIHHQAKVFFSNLVYNCTYKLDQHERDDYRNRDAWISTVEETVTELSSLKSILIPSAMDDWTTDVDMYNIPLERARLKKEGKLFKPFAHPMMNQVLGQMRNGQFIVYVARPKIGKCLGSGTEVLTPDGPKKMVDVIPGDYVMGYNADGSISPSCVLEKYNRGVQEVWDVTHRGKVLATCTREHRWLASVRNYSNRSDRLLSSAEIKHLGDRAQIKRDMVKIPCGQVKEPHAYAIGALLGDGCMTEGSIDKLVISTPHQELAEKVGKVLGYDYIDKSTANNYSWRIATTPNRGRGHSMASTAVMENTDISCVIHHYEKLVGKTARYKDFPKNIVDSWDRDSLLSFLAGLMDTDGSTSIDRNGLRISFCSTSPELLEIVHYVIYKLFQVYAQKIYDIEKLKNRRSQNIKWGDNGHYDKLNGRDEGSVVVAGNIDAIRMLKELEPYMVVEHKKYKEDMEDLSTWQKSDRVRVSFSETRLEQTWDIFIDNDTHLYLLANEGLVTHNTMSTLLDSHSVWSNTEEDVLYVSTEMDKFRIGARLNSIDAHYSNTALADGTIKRYDEAGTVIIEDDFDSYLSYRRELGQSQNRFWIRSRRNQHTGYMSPATIKADVLQKDVGLVVVDYIGNIDSDKKYHDNKSRIASIVYDLKDMAEDLGITVLAPQHTNREAVKSKVVGLEHVADADEISKAADLLLGINKQPFEDNKVAEEDFEETGSYLLTLSVIGGRDTGGEGTTFGWNWNFDNGVRFPIGDQFREARERGNVAGHQTPVDDPLANNSNWGF